MLKLEKLTRSIIVHAEDKLKNKGTEEARYNELFLKFTREKDIKMLWRSLSFRDIQSKPSVGLPVEEPTDKFSSPSKPGSVTLCAVDGSQIFPDRHHSSKFILINIGEVVLQDGTTERAILRSNPTIYFPETFDATCKEIFEADEEDAVRKVSIFRTIKEIEALSKLALENKKEQPRDDKEQPRATKEERPIVAIADGTLICWTMKNDEKNKALYVEALETYRKNKIPIVSYISYPSSKDCTYGLSIVLKDELFETLPDRVLWKRYLCNGERSAVFETRSEVMSSYHEKSKIYFCYIKAEHEIARIEFPRWVFDDGLVPLLHSVIVSEVKKNKGYPRVLSEAHEQAVVRQHETKGVFSFLERVYGKHNIPYERSAKLFSKDNRFI